MSKVATYLRGHLEGDVQIRKESLTSVSRDGGVLGLVPEMVVHPRSTNDIRKLARFCWQLAEKGHGMSLTARGAGLDSSGGAIGKGIVVSLTDQMGQIFELDTKQGLVRLQPGARVETIRQALSLYGQHIPALFNLDPRATIGGVISSGSLGPLSTKTSRLTQVVDRLEVVLANGDVLQTGRISRRDVDKQKGEQGLVGDIYRGIDRIIEDNADLLDSLDENDMTGYNSIADVRKKDGSFDLTPLFIGAQGSLGIISEMILSTEPIHGRMAGAALVYEKLEDARDALDDLSSLSPAILEYFDAVFFETAKAAGKTYEFYEAMTSEFMPSAVILVGVAAANHRAASKEFKKLKKIADRTNATIITASDDDADALLSALDVTRYTTEPDKADTFAPDLYSGFYVPSDRFEKFYLALQTLAQDLKVSLPLAGHVKPSIYGVYPTFSAKRSGDAQKMLKLIDELSKLVLEHSGAVISQGGEGRLKAKFIYPHLDEQLVQMYADIKSVCDPRGVFNDGVKSQTDVRALASMIRLRD